MATSTKAQALAAQVNAALKTNAVMMGNDSYFRTTYLRTGVLPIDHLLQGGIPYGRFVEIFGDYSTLKTYIGLMAIAACQREGKLAALIDTEHSYDSEWAAACGVDTDSLIIKQPDDGEQAIDVAEILTRGGVDLIVFDSIAAALPKAEREKSMGDPVQPARLADLMSRACRKLTAANKKTAYIWINQTRINVGVMFGSNEAVPGGKAMGFYASMRLAVRKAGREVETRTVFYPKDGVPTKTTIKSTIGTRIRATLEKSKLNVPHRETMFVFDHKNSCVDEWFYLALIALDYDEVGYGGGYWWLKTDRSGDGGKPKKYRTSQFRGVIGTDQLLALLQGSVEHLSAPVGVPEPAKKRASPRKLASSKPVEPKSTLAAVRAGSKTTARTVKLSTRSKTPIKSSR